MSDTIPYAVLRYTSHWVQGALAGVPQEEPQKTKCDGFYDLLSSLYSSQQKGGVSLVQSTWDALCNYQPNFAFLASWRDKFTHADDLKHLAFPAYLIEQYPIYEHGFNLLFGPSGTGKSFTALNIASCAAQNTTVIYVAGEGLAGYAPRWEALKAYHGIESAELIFYTEALQLLDTNELQQFIDALQDNKPGLVIIDTLARSAVGVEENSAKEMGAFIQACEVLREQLGCAVLLVHHTGVSGRIRGSTSLYAAADSVLALTNNDGIITLRNDFEGNGKNKHNQPAKPRFFKLEPYEVDGMKSAVLIEQDSDDVSIIPGGELTINQREILRALVNADNAMSAQEVIEITGISKSTVYRQLGTLGDAGYIHGVNSEHSDNKLYSLTDKAQGVFDES